MHKKLPHLAAPVLLAACSGGSAPSAFEQGAAEQGSEIRPMIVDRRSEDCLDRIWGAQGATEDVRAFDRANDAADGGPISCGTGTSASQFSGTIAAVRDAARSGDRARLMSEVGTPLLYIDRNGERRELAAAQDVDAAFDSVFDPATLNLLRELDLSRMTVIPAERGAYFDLGAVWLVVSESGGRPRIVTVNHQAGGEALDARAG